MLFLGSRALNMKTVVRILLGLVICLALGFGWWRYDHADRESQAASAALASLESDQRVTVSQDQSYVITPTDSTPTEGLIFYPGGEVDERGYAEPLHEIAAAGYLVVMVPMPLQLAIFGVESATDVIEEYPDIETWAIAGHSLGGAMAARYSHHHPEELAGLVMWDSYAPDDMTGSTLKIRMIHRADQAGNPPEDYLPHLTNMPESTEYYPLKGGTHLDFGNFVAGRMYRDTPPGELDADQQRKLVATETIGFMQEL